MDLIFLNFVAWRAVWTDTKAAKEKYGIKSTCTHIKVFLNFKIIQLYFYVQWENVLWPNGKRWFHCFHWFAIKTVSTTVTISLLCGVNNNKLQGKIVVGLKWDNVYVQLQLMVFNEFIYDHNNYSKHLVATSEHTLSFKTHL